MAADAGDTDPSLATAYHEAGHAVIARYLGADVGAVWIVPQEPKGQVSVFWPDEAPVDHQVMALLASLACLRAFGIPDPHDLHFLGDVVEISNLLETIILEDEPAQDAHRDRLEDAVAGLFARPGVRAAAQHLAQALHRERRLTGEEATAILDHHLGGGCATASAL